MPLEVNETISRTKKKKAAQALQRLGEELVTLSPGQLAGLNLPEELLEAVEVAKGIKKHEARRRQMQYIGSLMRQCDGAAIAAALHDLSRQDNAEVQRFKQIEHWRDELTAGDDQRFQWILKRFPHAEADRLTQLVVAARDLLGQKSHKKAGKNLFRYLRKVSEDSV